MIKKISASVKKYDVAVIGGGPAGMMAAIRAGERGARVILLEKNASLGLKLLATGNGRCNLTNVTADAKEMIGAYGKNGKFLLSAFHKFGVEDIIRYFYIRGVETKTENNGRVFPRTDKARDILDALINRLGELGVDVRLNAEVKQIIAGGGEIKKIILKNGDEISATNYIVAVGGMSFPGTGSSGDGYAWLRKLGHTIIKPRPALTPVVIKEKFIKGLEGLSLSGVEISVVKNGKKATSKIGEIIFTNDGISGPAIIDLSASIGEALSDDVFLRIDLQPEIDLTALDCKMHNDFQIASNRLFKNYLAGILPERLASTIIGLIGIDAEKKVNSVTREERKKLARILKEFNLEVESLKGFEKAMVTAGGADLKEVDPKTMRSRLFNNLFLAGEILDLNGPTGGYNLQICWSTGYVAGDSAGLVHGLVE